MSKRSKRNRRKQRAEKSAQATVLSYFDWVVFFVPPAVLAVWGAFLVFLFASGHLLQMQHPMFHIPVLVSGLILAVASCLYSLVFDPIKWRWQQIKWAAAGLLWILPVLSVFLTPAGGVSGGRMAASARQAVPAGFGQSLRQIDWKGADPRKALDVTIMDLVQGARAGQQEAMARVTVELEGRWLPSGVDHPPGLVQVVMWCCAADSRPVFLPVVEGQVQADKGDWVRLTGQVSMQPDGIRPQLKLSDWEEMNEPGRPVFFGGW